jgi:hypothetical protein
MSYSMSFTSFKNLILHKIINFNFERHRINMMNGCQILTRKSRSFLSTVKYPLLLLLKRRIRSELI